MSGDIHHRAPILLFQCHEEARREGRVERQMTFVSSPEVSGTILSVRRHISYERPPRVALRNGLTDMPQKTVNLLDIVPPIALESIGNTAKS